MRRVKKSFKIAALIVLSLLIAGAAGVSLFLYLFPKETVRALAIERAEKALKRKVTIGGIDYGIRGIYLTDVTVYDGPTDKNEVLARAGAGRVSVSLNALLKRRFDLNHISVEGLQLNIAYRKDESNLHRLLRDLAPGEESAFSTKLAYISLAKAKISLQNAPSSMKPLEGTYTVSGTVDISDTKKIEVSDCAIQLPEKRGALRTDSIMIATDDKGAFSLKSDLKLDNCSLAWVYLWKPSGPLPFRSFDGTVTDLVVTGEEVTGHARGSSLLSTGKLLSVDGHCRVHIPSLHTLIFNTSGESGKSAVQMKTLSIPVSGDIDRLVLTKIGVDFADVRDLVPFLPGSLYGNAAGNFSYENGTVNAELKISGASLGHRKKIIRDVNETIRISGNTFQKENISLTILDTPFRVSIATLGRNFDKLVVHAEAKEMTIDTEKPGDSDMNFSGVTIPVAVTGRVNVQKLFIDRYSFTQAFAAFSTSRKQVTVNRVSAKFMGGDLEGRGLIDFSRNAMDVETSFTFERLRVQNLAELSDKFKNRFFGTAQGRAELGFRVEKGAGPEKTAKGRLEFTIASGKLVDTGIQNGLGVVLSEMRYKLKDLEFSRIYGNFNILGPNYYVNLFQFEAPDIRLKLDGYMNRDLAGDLKMSLEFNKNFIQDLPNPALLQLSQYKRGGWYIIPFKIKGNITQSENITRVK